MWWWLAASVSAVVVAGFAQWLATSWLAGRTLVRAAWHLVAAAPEAEAVFRPILDRPQIARGATGWYAVPPFVYCCFTMVCAPVVGNTAVLAVEHGIDRAVSWAEVYPDPVRWIWGAFLFAGAVAPASSLLALRGHLRGWGLRVPGVTGPVPAVAVVGMLGLTGWVHGWLTGVDRPVSAVAMTAGAVALGWAGNRAVWGAYRELGLDLFPPGAGRLRAIVAVRSRSRAIARVVVWSSLLAVVVLGSFMRAFEGQVIRVGPELAAAAGVVPLLATVVKDGASDIGRAVAERHRLAFPEEP